MTLSRRRVLLGGVAALATSRASWAFGQEGAFQARVLITGSAHWGGDRTTAPGRWAWEIVRRTSAPARLVPTEVAADSPKLLDEPFVVWAGAADPGPLSMPEIRGLQRYLDLGGILLVDDSDPASGIFGRSTRRELLRVAPESPIVRLKARAGGDGGQEHVIYKSYYLLDRPTGRVQGPPYVEAIVRGRDAQVIFLAHDLLGALSRTADGTWRFPMESNDTDREYAIRFAVNIAMYVLCSNYKDDQVHAQALMRRRGRAQP